MTLGDRVWTAGGRLELQIHGGNIVRLANATDLAALNLTEDTQQFSLSAGVASFQIRRLGDDDVFEVDTPNAAITFERTGDYRVDVRDERRHAPAGPARPRHRRLGRRPGSARRRRRDSHRGTATLRGTT